MDNIVVNYQIMEVGFQIKCPENLLGYITGLMARYNFMLPVCRFRQGVKLNISIVSDVSFHKLKKAKLIIRYQRVGIKVYKKGNRIFVTDNSNLLTLCSNHYEGTLIIKKQGKLNLGSFLDNFILIATVGLLHSYGFFCLHAAGMAKNGQKVLFVSKNGGGKSTCALKLFLEGWRYLGDDLIFLRRNGKNQIIALSLTSELGIKEGNPILNQNRLYPFRKLFKKSNEIINDYRINISSIAPSQITQHFIPNLIFFPFVSCLKFSSVIPIEDKKTLPILIQQSKSIYFGDSISKDNTAVLLDLINQSRCFILALGKDIQGDRLTLSNTIYSLKV